MRQRVTCPDCQKPTFTGCGRHIVQVLGDAPPEQRCRCRESARLEPTQGRTLWTRHFEW